MFLSRIAPALAVLCSMLLAGCGGPPSGPPQLPTVPVSGIVTYQGQPVPQASVTFQHVDGVVTANGATDEAGRFSLTSYGGKDGAPAGSYRVVVAVSTVQEIEPGVLAPEPEEGFQSPIPLRYANPAESGLTAVVPAGGVQDLAITLE